MRNWYNRSFIVVHAPVSEKRGRTFERKLAKAQDEGFEIVGQPTFSQSDGLIFGTVLLFKRPKK